MSLAAILKVAALFGLDLNSLRQLAISQGIPAARAFVLDYARKKLNRAKPRILANLAEKAPLDGQNRTDLDGIEMTDREYFVHEADYPCVKAVIRHGGKVIDAIRDKHFPKVVGKVLSTGASTQAALLDALVDAEVELTF